MKLHRTILYVLVLLCFTTVLAQSADCSAMVKQAMADVQQSCGSTGRNQACYGYVSLSATPRQGAQNFSFSKAGDLANVADLASLQLTPLDSAKNTWGIVLMKLQANLPDTLPGENVTFLMFGDVQIQNAVSANGTASNSASTAATAEASAASFHPMQAFYFKTGVGKTSCAGAPADGLMIQTPKGAGQIRLRANNVDIQLGSTAYLQAQPGAHMNVKVIEGKGHLTSGGKTVVIPAGSEVNIPIDEELNADGAPSDPEAYDESEVADLPVEDLPDEITVAPPADDQEIQQAIDEGNAEMTNPESDAGNSEITNSEPDMQPTDAGQDQPPGDSQPDGTGG